MRNLRRIMSFVLILAILLTGFISNFRLVYAEESQYSNVDKAKTLYEMGLFKGTSEATFEPDLGSQLNRQQGFAMIIRLLGKSEAAEALSDEQVENTLKKFSDGTKIEDSLKKSVAFAILNGLVKGDGTNIMPLAPMTGRDFATLILRNLGYKDDEFKYEYACSELADRKGIDISEAMKLNDKELKRDDLVGIAYSSLNTVGKDGKTVIENLVSANPKLADIAEKAGIYPKTESTPASSPDVTPNSTPGSSPAPVSNGGSGSKKSHTPTPTVAPTATPTPESTPTSSPVVTPTPLPETELDFNATAVGAKKILLDFNKTIDTDKAVVSLSRYGEDTVIANTYSSNNNTRLTIITSTPLFYGSYNVSVAGLSENTMIKSMSAENEKVTKIEFLSNKAYINPDNKEEAYIYYKIYNQYNEEISFIDLSDMEYDSSDEIVNIEKNRLTISNDEYGFEIGRITAARILYAGTYNNISAETVFTLDEVGGNTSVNIPPIYFGFKYSVIPNIFDQTNKSVIGQVHIYDQNYTEITKQVHDDSNIYIKSEKGTVGPIDENGRFIVTADSEFHLDDTVMMSVYHKAFEIEDTSMLYVREAEDTHDAHIIGVYNKDNLELTINNVKSNKFYLLFDVKDEYGMTVTDITYIQRDFHVDTSNASLLNVSEQFINLNVNGTNKIAMEIIPYEFIEVTGGEVVIDVFNFLGEMSHYTIVFSDGPNVNLAYVNEVDYVIAGEKTVLKYTVFDENGNETKDWDYISANVSVVATDGYAYFWKNELTGKAELFLDLTANTDIYNVAIYITTNETTASPSKTRRLWLEVKRVRPIAVTGIEENVYRNIFADGGSVKINPADIQLKDQFGRDINTEFFSNSYYAIKLIISDINVISFSNSTPDFDAGFLLGADMYNVYPTIYAVGKGKANVRIILQERIYTPGNYGTSYDYADIGYYDVEFNVVDNQDIVSYSLAELPTAFIDSKAFYGNQTLIGNTGFKNQYDSHAVVPVVEGVLLNGTKVTIPARNKNGVVGAYYSIYTENTPFSTEIQYYNYRLTIADPNAISFINGETVKEYPIRVIVKGYNSDVELNGNIKVSNVAPTAVKFVLRPATEMLKVSSNALDTVTNLQPVPFTLYSRDAANKISISYTDLNNIETGKTAPSLTDKITALVNRVVKMTDQYGKNIIASTSVSSSILPSYTYYNDPTKVYNYAFNNVEITDLYRIDLNDPVVDGYYIGEHFKVTATTESGLKITFTVEIK